MKWVCVLLLIAVWVSVAVGERDESDAAEAGNVLYVDQETQDDEWVKRALLCRDGDPVWADVGVTFPQESFE